MQVVYLVFSMNINIFIKDICRVPVSMSKIWTVSRCPKISRIAESDTRSCRITHSVPDSE